MSKLERKASGASAPDGTPKPAVGVTAELNGL